MKTKLFIPIISFLILGLLVSCSPAASLAPSSSPEPQEQGSNALQVPTRSTPSLPAGESALSLQTLQQSYQDVYNKVLPSVVNITVITKLQAPRITIPNLPEPFESPDSETPEQYQQTALGSGFVWDAEGHIVTNNHVVTGADIIRVTFSNGNSLRAELVGSDSDSDLAVIKVDPSAADLQPIQVLDSTQVQVGQLAIAVGNPYGLEGTMTTGIISGLGRSLPLEANEAGVSYTIPDVIQTDAPINPGNSGGVLVDINGQLIGVTTAIESPVRANAGIGYVVPSIIVQKVVPALIENGSYQHAWLGISGRTLTSEIAEAMNLPADQRGVLVAEITANSPAEKADLRGSETKTTIDGLEALIGGDVIVSIDDTIINDFEDLAAFLARYAEVGQTVQLGLIRDGKQITLSVTLVARPEISGAEPTPETPREISGSAWLGIQGITLNSAIAEAMQLRSNTRGVLIQQILQGSPAEKAGLRGSYKSFDLNGQQVLIGGDVITKLDDTPIVNMDQLSQSIATFKPGDSIQLTILRDGKTQTVKLTLAERPG